MSIAITDKSRFTAEVTASQSPVLVDFWATWCGPCRMIASEVEALEADHPELKVVKVNVDEAPAIANEYGVSAIPTLIVFKNGKPSASSVGYKTKDSLEKLLK